MTEQRTKEELYKECEEQYSGVPILGPLLVWLCQRGIDATYAYKEFWDKLPQAIQNPLMLWWGTAYRDLSWLGFDITWSIDKIDWRLWDIWQVLREQLPGLGASLDATSFAINLLAGNVSALPPQISEALAKELLENWEKYIEVSSTTAYRKLIEFMYEESARIGVGGPGAPPAPRIPRMRAYTDISRLTIDYYQGLYEGIIRWLIEPIIYKVRFPAIDPIERASMWYDRLFQLVVAPQIILKIVEWLMPLKRIDLDGIWRSFIWNLGVQWMSWAVWGPILRKGLIDDIERWLNSYLSVYAEAQAQQISTKAGTMPVPITPEIPTITQIADWVSKGLIAKPYLYAIASVLGYGSFWADYYLEAQYAPPSYEAIRDLVKEGVISLEQAMKWFSRHGYHPEALELVAKRALIQITDKYKDLTTSQILKLYEYGLISKDQALDFLKSIDYPEREAKLLIELRDYEKLRDLLDLRIKKVLEDLKDGVISRDMAINELIRLGLTREKAIALSDLELARRRTVEREKLTKSDIRTLLKHNLIDVLVARDWLIHIGYRSDIATAIVNAWLLDFMEKERELSRSDILRAYRMGMIDRARALEMLENIGYVESVAELLIRMEEFKIEQELVELQQKIILEDLKDGIISESEALDRLIRIGITHEKAELLVRLTIARKRVERRERIDKSDIRLLLINGLISSDEAKSLLVTLGYSEKFADLLVTIWKSEKTQRMRDLTTSQITRLYSYGLITREQAKKMLIALGYDDYESELLLSLEDQKAMQELIELQQKVILLEFRYGRIDKETAIRELVNLGITHEKAELLVSLEEFRKRTDTARMPSKSDIEEFFKAGLISEETTRLWLQRLGYDPETISLYIQKWKLEVEPKSRELSYSQVLRAYRVGVIDREMAKSFLIDIGYTSDEAELIIRTIEAEEINDLIRLRERNILEMYRYDIISEEQARSALAELGLAPTRIELLIERERIRKQRPPTKRRITASMVLRAFREGIIDYEMADELLKELGYYDERDRAIMILLYAPETIVGE